METHGGGQVRIANDFQASKLATAEERRAYLQRFLRRQPAFAALIERFPEQLPSDDTLMRVAVLSLGLREPAAQQLVKMFRDSVEFSGYEPQGATTILTVNGVVDLPRPPVAGSAPVVASTMPIGDGDYDDPIPIRLRGGRKAWLRLPKPFYEADKNALVNQVNLIIADEEGAT